MLEMKRRSRTVIATVGRIHPRGSREGLAPRFLTEDKDEERSEPEMVPLHSWEEAVRTRKVTQIKRDRGYALAELECRDDVFAGRDAAEMQR